MGFFAIGPTGMMLANDTLFLDDFENASQKRIGNPEIVSGMTSPGLLSGVYRGERVTILDKSEGWVVPVAGKIRFFNGDRIDETKWEARSYTGFKHAKVGGM